MWGFAEVSGLLYKYGSPQSSDYILFAFATCTSPLDPLLPQLTHWRYAL